jgi:hypothetical protein
VPRDKSITDQFIEELKALPQAVVLWVNDAPDFEEQAKRMRTGPRLHHELKHELEHLLEQLLRQVEEGCTKEQIATSLRVAKVTDRLRGGRLAEGIELWWLRVVENRQEIESPYFRRP